MKTMDMTRPPMGFAVASDAESRARAVILLCGIASSALYVGMNVFVPMEWPGYDWTSQTISELSAIDAPTRTLWMPLAFVYTLLVVAMGLGLRRASASNAATRMVGTLMLTYGAIGLFWPSMHLRGVEPSLTDSLHLLWSVTTVILMIAILLIAAAGFGDRFRIFSYAALTVFAVFGILTGLEVPDIAANLPTPWVGLWERVAVGAFMIWVVVMAVVASRSDAFRHGYEASRSVDPPLLTAAGRAPTSV